jgi:GTP pyrophosphokinase
VTVQVREATSPADPHAWLREAGQRFVASEQALLQHALALAVDLYGDRSRADGELLLTHCREVARILSDLSLDAESLAAGLACALPAVAGNWHELAASRLSPGVAALVEGVERMGQIRGLRGKVERASRPEERAAQLEALRKMLLAMVQDVRVVLVALADQTQRLRYLAGHGAQAEREAAARDTFDLFAPLANRLGVWQLKWEMEDLAFRCASPDVYKAIARELDEKREDREQFIAHVMEVLRRELAEAGIAAEVTGRPKHIYSIYRKLSRKDLTLTQLFDIRGVRVLVEDIRDCYAALGLVHSLWTPLAREFDDYIAKPKPNNYRSLHTAVVGPDGKVLEVQIRTYEMHQQCEYGVAAHWRYKEQPARREGGGSRRSAAAFEESVARMSERLTWLRQILEWRDGLADVADLAEHLRSGLFEDTIYVLTPQGRVIDLPHGSTPVDFAYHVHSELGHRCRGAKVDGQMVPLDRALENGQTVEIVTASSGGPSRDWLNPDLGYLHSARARAKVRQWFNSQNLEAAIAQGRLVVEKLLQRQGMTALSLDKLAAQLQLARVEDLLAAVGRSELTSRQLQAAVQELGAPTAPASAGGAQPLPPALLRTSPEQTGRATGDILVVGVDKLLTALARCCKPAPPDPIIGFITRGKGVSIHRRSCPNVARLPEERLIEAQWGADASAGSFPVDVEVEGSADPRVMRDVLDVLSREKVRVLAARTSGRELQARLLFTLEVSGAAGLGRVLDQMRQVDGVTGARRR